MPGGLYFWKVINYFVNIKCSKKEAIKLVFGTTKGTSKKYKAASYWYEEIKGQIK